MNSLLKTLLFTSLAMNAWGNGGNRLAHLHDDSPYYPSHLFPKLTTEQWVGEPEVKGVVVFAVDDLNETTSGHFDNFLKPLASQLKKHYGKAPISIMACRMNPDDPMAQKWFADGYSIDCHTHTHPCPLFDKGDFAAAKWTYETCIDQLGKIPGNKPVAYRMPCLDIWNTTSPKFYSEIFNKVTTNGNFLTMSSSITVVFNSKDPEMPRGLVVDEEGRERFGKYMNQRDVDVFGRVNYQYGNFVQNYPYPVVVSKLGWEIPMVTSDHTMALYWGRYGNNTLRDWKAAIDATVLKQGTLALCFHTGGEASKPAEFVNLVDTMFEKHGKALRYMTFPEIQQRIDRNFLAGHPLRAKNGQDNGVRVLDVNNDGFLDVVIGNETAQLTRIWNPEKKAWKEIPFPARIVEVTGNGDRLDAGVRFGVFNKNGSTSFLVKNEKVGGVWTFNGEEWQEDKTGFSGLESEKDFATARGGVDQGVRLIDLDNDGICELVWSNSKQSKIYRRGCCAWHQLSFGFPSGVSLVDERGKDGGLRFASLNGDKFLDIIASNEQRFAISWLENLEKGWSRTISHKHGEAALNIPPIVRNGMNNGVWFDEQRMWAVNEHTGGLPDHAQIVSFSEINELSQFKGGTQVLGDWMVVGPFQNEKESGFHTVYPPEKSLSDIDASARFTIEGREVGWEHVKPAGGMELPGFSLEAYCNERKFKINDRVVYLFARLNSSVAQKSKLLLGSEDGVKVWLNGELIHQKFVRRKARAGEDRIAVNFKAGENALLIKLEQIGAGGWLLAALANSEVPVEVIYPAKSGESVAHK